MVKDSSSALYPRFAVATFLAIAVIAALAGLVSAPFARRSSERAAAESAASNIAAPLRSIFQPLSGDAPVLPDLRARAQALAEPLVTGDLRGLRVWDAQGQPVIAAGAGWSADLPSVPNDDPWWGRTPAPGGGKLFVTFTRAGAYTIEVDQSARGVDEAVAVANRQLAGFVAVLALGCFAVTQVAFMLVVRGLISKHRWLLHLYRRGDAIRSSLDLQEVLTQVARDATVLAGGAHGLVVLHDEGSGDLVLRTTFSRRADETAQHQRPIEEWYLRRCAITNATVIASAPASAFRQFFGPDLDASGQLALVCVPLALLDRVAGVVAVARAVDRKSSSFSTEEVLGIEQIAAQAVTALEQATLFAKMRTYANEVEVGYDATLKALMAALDAKDEATVGHCERVARLTLHLARRMGIPETQLLDIERGAMLHDVGKIGVPDAVLKKPKELNAAEWETMRKHPLLAAVMVSDIGFLEPSLPVLMYHHERFDGGGYPFGMSGDKIPLEARIFSVVDAYDAMTSDRPYRLAMTHEAAMSEVGLNSGGQFDPEVVAQFDALMAARPELRHQHPQSRGVEPHGHGRVGPATDANAA
jgi:HD-GYP domain-containing protein (c-di-GMP phosphodiesterase class II)